MSGVSVASSMLQSMFTGSSVAVKKDGVFQFEKQQASLVYTQIAIKAIQDISPMAEVAIQHIAKSSLTHDQKEALIRLAAYVNENGGDPSFFRDITALVSLMEMGVKGESTGSDAMSIEEAVEIFRGEQAKIADNSGVILSVELAFQQFESRYLGGVAPKGGSTGDMMQAMQELNTTLKLGGGASLLV